MTEGEKAAYEAGKFVGENIGLTKGLKIAAICVVITSLLCLFIK
jgi:tetrahydromethanopterin S-methyltransferase subunit G